MPALFTHYKFGQDVLKNVNSKLSNDISSSIHYYNMFNQGFDNLYYYPIKWNYYKNFAIKAHKNKIPDFFTNMIKYILDNNINNPELNNMIYGFINHYTIDTIIHPFINYQVKNLNISHTRIEYILDSKINKDFNTKIYKTVIPRLHFSKDLIKMIDYVFINTHNEKNIGKIFNRSHNNDYYIYRYFVHDKKGIKTKFYKIFDLVFRNKKFPLHENTFYVKEFDPRIINEDKNNWHNPKNKNELYNYSYNELYNYSLIIATKVNNLAYDVIHNNKDLEELIDLITLININNIPKFL